MDGNVEYGCHNVHEPVRGHGKEAQEEQEEKQPLRIICHLQDEHFIDILELNGPTLITNHKLSVFTEWQVLIFRLPPVHMHSKCHKLLLEV